MPNPRRARRRAPALLLTVVAASVVALVATTLSTPAVAAPRSARVGVTHTKKAPAHWSRSVRAKHALARANKAFSPETPAAERPDATLALRNLWLLKDALSPADRAAAEKLSQRPSKPAVVGDANILMHYDPAELGYDINAAFASMVYVADTYAGSGYRRPKSDGTKGGDARVDIYIDQLEPGLYGYCTTDQKKLTKPGHYDVWAYCVLDADYSGFPRTPIENFQVTAAHEYYHATQFAYDIADDNWFLEATATWAEDELYTAINDNYQYLKDSPITHPGKSMDKFGGVFHYGVWNFFRYLSEHYPAKVGAMPGLLLQMWKNADSSKGPRKDMYSTQAINKALKKAGHTSMAEQFADYSAATRIPALTFSEGAALGYPAKSLAGASGSRRREAQDLQDQARPPDQCDLPVRAGRRDHQAQAAAEDGLEVRRLARGRDDLRPRRRILLQEDQDQRARYRSRKAAVRCQRRRGRGDAGQLQHPLPRLLPAGHALRLLGHPDRQQPEGPGPGEGFLI